MQQLQKLQRNEFRFQIKPVSVAGGLACENDNVGISATTKNKGDSEMAFWTETKEEMLAALNRLPEDEKRWADVRKALANGASERTIHSVYERRCPEAKDPDLRAWQAYTSAENKIRDLSYKLSNYWEGGDVFTRIGTAMGATDADLAEYEEYKAYVQAEIGRLNTICAENQEGYERWRVVTGSNRIGDRNANVTKWI